MKIIINQPRASYFVGGGELISFDHAINLLTLGNEVAFITINPMSVGLKYSEQYRSFVDTYQNRIRIIEINQDNKALEIYKIVPGEDRCRWNIESIFYNKKLSEYLSQNGELYDAMLSYYNLDAVYLPSKLIMKNVLYLCGTPKQRDDYQGSFLSVYDTVIAITENVQKYWQKYRTEKINVISTGVNYNKFKPLKKNKERIREYYNLLYVGRLIKRKNVDKIILAVNALKNKYPIKLTIVGDGPEKSMLETLSSSDNVEFVGVKDNVDYYYKNADIFISPSEYGEGVQGAILEAMSSGLVVVATNTRVNKSLIEKDKGFLIRPNVDDIIEGIELAINSNMEVLGEKAREFIIKNYDWLKKTREIQEEIEK